MKREKYSEELKANIIIYWKKRKTPKAKIARKFGLSGSGVRQFMDEYRDEVKSEEFSSLKGFDLEFKKVEIPDENLQSKKDRIAFYLNEAKKYKKLSRLLEKKGGFLLEERKLFCAKQIKKCVENYDPSKVDEAWKMTHEEFLEFFDAFSAI